MTEIPERIRAGLALLEREAWEEAERIFGELAGVLPGEPEILHLAARTAFMVGDPGRGLALVGRALALQPERADFHTLAGMILQAMGRRAPARERFEAALALAPDDPEARVNLGGLLQESGLVAEAVVHYRHALARDPGLAGAHYNLGCALRALGDQTGAEAHFRETLRLRPGHDRAQYNLGILLQEEGRHEEGVACFRAAWTLRPGYARARWKMLLDLPILIDDEERIASLRQTWREGVEALLESPLESPGALREAWEAASAVSNFYLSYQGRNDLAEQLLYGRLLTRVAGAVHPRFTVPLTRARGARLRVGFVSGFFYGHSIFKTHGAWITRLDGERFERFVFHVGSRRDLSTEFIRERVEHFFWLPPEGSGETLVASLARARLDVLIYTDLGMDARLHPVSALRLAPLQCNGGGHPVTSGLPTLDCFLSSVLMEPEGAQAHYSERLVLLPNLGSCYPRPRVALAVPPAGFAPGRVTYVNLQSLFKLLPRHDALYPRIAREVPGSRFFFIGVTEAVSALFLARMRRAFARLGLDADAHVVLLPRMSHEAFFGLAKGADVILDGLSWSGNNSSLEALACDVPVVTMAGPFFRSRHTFGMMRRMHLPELVAADEEAFVALAVRLGLDPSFREELRTRIHAVKDLLYEDESVPLALGDFLLAASDHHPSASG